MDNRKMLRSIADMSAQLDCALIICAHTLVICGHTLGQAWVNSLAAYGLALRGFAADWRWENFGEIAKEPSEPADERFDPEPATKATGLQAVTSFDRTLRAGHVRSFRANVSSLDSFPN
jgi:hypothetical protein